MGTAARLGLFKDVAPVIPVRVSRDLIEMCGKAYEMTRVHLADVARRARSQLTLRACEKQRGAAYKAVRSSLRSRETELLAAVAAAVAAACRDRVVSERARPQRIAATFRSSRKRDESVC